MFSPNIQNYINTSGEAAAKARIKQLANYAASLTPVGTDGAQSTALTAPKSPFADILKTTANENSASGLGGLDNQNGLGNFGSLSSFGVKIPENKNLFNVEDIDLPPNIEAMGKVAAANKIGSFGAITKREHLTKEQIFDMIEKTSQKYGLDEKLVKALVKQESGFNPNAKSHAGALGLMQLMPQTAQGLGVVDPLNPAQNIEGGVKYLSQMMKKFNGNTILALAAYNAGPGAVEKYGTVPPYKETQNYVQSILKDYLW